jgi:hypothetical protein
LVSKKIRNATPENTFNWVDWTLASIAFFTFVASQMLFDVATWLLAYNYFICADKLDKI